MLRRVLAVMAVLALAVPVWAEGPQKNCSVPKTIKVELSGYGVNLNPGEPAVVRGIGVYQGRSSLGPVSSTDIGFNVAAYDPTVPTPEWCTGTTVVFLPVAEPGHLGLRFEATGELLQGKNVVDGASGICFDWMTNHYTGRALATIVAGTGRFQGAKGTMSGRLWGYCPEPECAFLSQLVRTMTIELEK